jgi:hypothetical protein
MLSIPVFLNLSVVLFLLDNKTKYVYIEVKMKITDFRLKGRR